MSYLIEVTHAHSRIFYQKLKLAQVSVFWYKIFECSSPLLV